MTDKHNKKYVVALDQGTTSSRAIVFDRDANVVSQAQREFAQFYPQAGWVEHDPMEIWATQSSTLVEALAQASIEHDRGRHRYHQPARDHGGLGPSQRSADPQRHRLAVPAQRGDLRAAQARRAGRLHPRNHRAGHRSVLLRDQAEVDPRQRRRRPRTRAQRRPVVRHHRHLADLEAHRRQGPRHRLHQCLADHAVQYPQPRLGRTDARGARHSPLDATRGAQLFGGLRQRPDRRGSAAASCRSPGSPATSRPPYSARCAWNRARRRTPTAPAASC